MNKVMLMFAALILLSACTVKHDVNLDSLANCLADKNVREYGAFWCPHCAEQTRIFGTSDSILKERSVYVECDPRCVPDEKGNLILACRGIKGQPELCLAKNITNYPGWEFPDGKKHIGELEPEDLARMSGCSYGGNP